MKHLSSTSWLFSVLVLLCGCGGDKSPQQRPNPPPSAPRLNASGNWQFRTTSTAGFPSLSIAGSMTQSGLQTDGSVKTALYVVNSPCFGFDSYDLGFILRLTGTMDGSDNISLVSPPVAGQVVTFTGSFTEDSSTGAESFTGTFSVQGGCDDADQGAISGNKIPFIANVLNGTLTVPGGGTFDLTADVAQDKNPGAAGSYSITGTATFATPCFSSGTLITVDAPSASGSYVVGTFVSLVIETDNGRFVFGGTADPDKAEISGGYSISGGTCDQTSGTGTLVGSGPWDY